MKRFLPFLVFLAAALASVAPNRAAAADYLATQVLQLVQAHPDDAAVEAALTRLGLGAGQRREEALRLVAAMRREIQAGVTPGSEAFWQLLGRGERPPAETGRGGISPPPPAAPSGRNEQLYAVGRAALLGKSRLDRENWLHFNGAPYATGSARDWQGDASVRLAAIRYGAKLLQQVPERDDELARGANAHNTTQRDIRVKAGGDTAKALPEEPAPDVAEPVVEPPEVDEVLFRDAGISFASGFGVVRRRGDDAAIGSILARWNLWQRVASAKWNRWIGTDLPENYRLVPYRGVVEYYTGGRATGEARFSRQPVPRDDHRFGALQLTHLGPFLGTAAVGERVRYRKSDGTEFFERPWLIGLSVGFGFLTSAAPAFTVDVGSTISPSRGFDGRDLYLGLSLDAALLQKVMNLRLSGKSTKGE